MLFRKKRFIGESLAIQVCFASFNKKLYLNMMYKTRFYPPIYSSQTTSTVHLKTWQQNTQQSIPHRGQACGLIDQSRPGRAPVSSCQSAPAPKIPRTHSCSGRLRFTAFCAGPGRHTCLQQHEASQLQLQVRRAAAEWRVHRRRAALTYPRGVEGDDFSGVSVESGECRGNSQEFRVTRRYEGETLRMRVPRKFGQSRKMFSISKGKKFILLGYSSNSQ